MGSGDQFCHSFALHKYLELDSMVILDKGDKSCWGVGTLTLPHNTN